jgi:hypothetical protein
MPIVQVQLTEAGVKIRLYLVFVDVGSAGMLWK